LSEGSESCDVSLRSVDFSRLFDESLSKLTVELDKRSSVFDLIVFHSGQDASDAVLPPSLYLLMEFVSLWLSKPSADSTDWPKLIDVATLEIMELLLLPATPPKSSRALVQIDFVIQVVSQPLSESQESMEVPILMEVLLTDSLQAEARSLVSLNESFVCDLLKTSFFTQK
jgi:hypothetical protein